MNKKMLYFQIESSEEKVSAEFLYIDDMLFFHYKLLVFL